MSQPCSIPDEELVKRFTAGDMEAFEAHLYAIDTSVKTSDPYHNQISND